MFAKSDYATYHWAGGVYANDDGQSKNVTSKSSLGPVSLSCETSEMTPQVSKVAYKPRLVKELALSVFILS